MRQQFLLAPEASPEFNERLWTSLSNLGEETASALGDDLVAVVLGGGYGRGSGSMVFENGQEMPFNDVDLFLITTTRFPQAMAKIDDITKKYENSLAISVDFSRPITIPMIKDWPCLLMWQELALGHKVLCGPSDVLLANVPDRVLQPLPLVEASRLLLNRGAGLVWAGRVLDGTDPCPDPSFIERNFYKCMLALADALLISERRYTSDGQEKLIRILALAETDNFLEKVNAIRLITAGLEYRRLPGTARKVSQNDLRWLANLWLECFFRIESRRLESDFPDLSCYLSWKRSREPQESTAFVRLLSNLKRKQVSMKHPREAVYAHLPLAITALRNNSPEFTRQSAQALGAWRRAQ